MRTVKSELKHWAGVFVVVLLLGLVDARNSYTPPVMAVVFGAFVVAVCIDVVPLYIRQKSNPIEAMNGEDQIRWLEQQDLLIDTNFRAIRAFEVEEYEDLGENYFIELTDGSILFLSGQYLYEYQEIVDLPEVNQPRTFPCTDFTIRRHRTEGYWVDMQCRGNFLSPEIIAPCFSGKDSRGGRAPQDGDIIRNRTYDQIKAEFAGDKEH